MMKNYNLLKIISASEIQTQIKLYAANLNARYLNQNLTLIVIMRGAFYFAADLTRYLSQKINLQIFFLTYKTYHFQQKTSQQQLVNQFDQQLPNDLSKQHLLVLDDILDTGQTIADLHHYFQQLKPLSLRFAVLIKNHANQSQQQTLMGSRQITLDHLFTWTKTTQTNWLIGYGMDLNEAGRHLRSIFAINVK